jgi:16S rRNA (cytosine1402-N4)-methyltransferase
MAFSHVPVLLQQTIEALRIDPQGVYVDCTAGGGGHSAAILDRLQSGMLVDVDRDPQAIEALRARFAGRANVRILHGNFFDLPALLSDAGIDGADGILADLGVSSHQLDTAERGFSFHQDAPLDMRMSQEGMTAADYVNTLSEAELADVLFRYGEEKYARSIAAGILRARAQKPIETTLELADIVRENIPAKARRDKHPARKTFQALRILVNSELDVLKIALDQAFDALNPGGRLVILTFHSLEDRMVKQAFAERCAGCICPPEFPVCVCGRKPQGFLPHKKPLTASAAELAVNPRSRSAKLRCIEKAE